MNARVTAVALNVRTNQAGFLPWSALGLDTATLCVEWLQTDLYAQHFGEGGQAPVGNGCGTAPSPPPIEDAGLVTRPGGRVLDPFAGSGTTGEAALLEGMECDLIELEADHLPLILARVRKPLHPAMFGGWEFASSAREEADA